MEKINFQSVCGLVMGENNLKELAKNVKSLEKALESLKKNNATQEEISLQQDALNAAKKRYEDSVAAQQQVKENFSNTLLTFQVADEETGAFTNMQKKIAYVKHNRPIDEARVNNFATLIGKGRYDKAYPIIVADTKKLMEIGYEVYDMKGNKLTLETAEEYYVILDGQHRSKAFAKLIAAGKDCAIPNVHIRNVENIGEYLTEINNTGKSWTTKDKLSVAALTANSHKELFAAISTLIDKGFSPSTATLILTKKKFSEALIQKVLKGEEIDLPKGATEDIKRGMKFVSLCEEANLNISIITKRYFIDGFNSYSIIKSDDDAFRALEAIRNLRLKDEDLKEVKGNDDFIAILKKAKETTQD